MSTFDFDSKHTFAKGMFLRKVERHLAQNKLNLDNRETLVSLRQDQIDG